MNLYDRFQFPEGMIRVTAGAGGEAILVKGSEKNVLIDCGMAYCGDAMTKNIADVLEGHSLDYVVLSHTHYDHVGGLPYVRRAWPNVIVFGASYAEKILNKDSARVQIAKLSANAWKEYEKMDHEPDVLMEGLGVDRVICEKDIIPLGDKEIHVFETPGHTNCSITLLLEPDQVVFASETAGVYSNGGRMMTGMLKSRKETLESIQKSKKINARYIISPHYGMVPEQDKNAYWDKSEESVRLNTEFILEQLDKGIPHEGMLKAYTEKFWIDERMDEQPKEAFLQNAIHMINNVLREMNEE